MDQGRIYENLPMIVLMGTLVLLQIMPDAYKGYMLWGGMGGAIIMMVFTDEALKWKASEYLHLRMVMRPENKIVNFFITKAQEGFQSRLIDPLTNTYETPLTTKEKVNLPHYGDTRDASGHAHIILRHQMAWEKRMLFLPGKAPFRGYEIDHNASCTITVWEKRRDPEVLDHLEPIPIYVVAEAPQDYNVLDTEPIEIIENGQVNENLENINDQETSTALATLPTTKGKQQTTEQQENQVQVWKNIALDWKTRYHNDHRKLIRYESQVGGMKNEFHGITGQTEDTDALLFEREQTHLARHIDIYSAVHSLKHHNWFQITRNVVILVLGVFGIAELATNGELRAWIGANQLLFIVPIIGIAALFIYLQRRK